MANNLQKFSSLESIHLFPIRFNEPSRDVVNEIVNSTFNYLSLSAQWNYSYLTMFCNNLALMVTL